MGIIADTSAVFALFDRRDRFHEAVREALERAERPLVVPVAILAEISYMLQRHLGQVAEIDFMEAVQQGFFTLEQFTASDLIRVIELLTIYRDLNLGLADSAIIATAERLKISTIVTLDERDFRAVKPRFGHFTILPADAT